jgi:hypothetical protein
MMSAHPQRTHQVNQHRSHIQPKEEKESNGRAPDRTLAGVAPGAATQLPGRASQALRQSAVLQMQRVQGNNFVQRAVEVGEIESQAAVPPNQIAEPGASVSVANGVAEVNAPMVTINAPITRVNGILQSDTLITNSVISASYSPGAGNIW